MVAIVVSGIILKKTKPFEGEVAPFVMELPAYHMPTFKNLMRSVGDRTLSFIKKAGTVILISTVVVWIFSHFGVVEGRFLFDTEMELGSSLLGYLGIALSYLFKPLGFGTIEAAVATVMGLIAKEEIVGVLGVLDFGGMSKLAGYSFLAFNLLCAPCFAAMGAIRREMNSGKWTLFAIGYQCGFAYIVSLMINQIGNALSGNIQVFWFVLAMLVLAALLFLLFRPAKKKTV